MRKDSTLFAFYDTLILQIYARGHKFGGLFVGLI
jgi:hypothetical protein